MRSMQWQARALLVCFLFARRSHGLDSLQACRDSAPRDNCTFELPTVEDRWEDVSANRAGAERAGICSTFGRGLENVTSGEPFLFCRAVPSPEEMGACVGRKGGQKCWVPRNQSLIVDIKAFTQVARWADTRAPVFVSFLMDDNTWTPPSFFFKGVKRGGTKRKRFIVPSWPRKLALSMQDSDAWGFWKLVVNGRPIVQDPRGKRGSDAYRSFHAGRSQISPAQDQAFARTKYWVEGPPASQGFPMPTHTAIDPANLLVEAWTSNKAHAETRGCAWAAFLVNGQWEKQRFFCGARRGQVKRKGFQVGGVPSRVWLGMDSTDEWGFWKVAIAGTVVREDPGGHKRGEQFSGNGRQSAFSYWMESPGRTKTFDIPAGLGQRQVPSLRKLGGRCKKAWTAENYCETWSTGIVDQWALGEAKSRGQALVSGGHAEVPERPCNVSGVSYDSLGTGRGYNSNGRGVNLCWRRACWAENQSSCEAVCTNWAHCQGYAFGQNQPGRQVTCHIYTKPRVRSCPGTFDGAFARGDNILEAAGNANDYVNWTSPIQLFKKLGSTPTTCRPDLACPKDTENSIEKEVVGVMEIKVTSPDTFMESRKAHRAVTSAIKTLSNLNLLTSQGFETSVEVTLLPQAPAARRLQGSTAIAPVVEAHFRIFLRGGAAAAGAVAGRLESRWAAMDPARATQVLRQAVTQQGTPWGVEVKSVSAGAQAAGGAAASGAAPPEAWEPSRDRPGEFPDDDGEGDEDVVEIDKTVMTGLAIALIATGTCLCVTIAALTAWVFTLRRKVKQASQPTNMVVQGADVAIGRPVENITVAPAGPAASCGVPVELLATEKPPTNMSI